MPIRTAAIILAVAVLVAVLLATRFGTRIPFSRPVVVEEKIEFVAKPRERPDRPDLETYLQFEAEPMSKILLTLASPSDGGPVEKSPASALLSSLPSAPFPFAEGASPVNEIALQQFVQSVETGKLGKLTMADRWRYNLAIAALGKEPDSLEKDLKLQLTRDIQTENFPVKLVERDFDLEGPLAVGNFNGDPALEIFGQGGTQLWTTDENGGFVETGDPGNTTPGHGLRAADYDNDGDLDVLVIRGGGLPNSLLQNNGEGQFEDVTRETGLLAFSDTSDVEWSDFDRDGKLDLFVGNRDHPFEVYHQAETGRFVPIAWDMELWFPMNVVDVKAADLNKDRFPDLLVSIEGAPDRVLIAMPSSEITNWRFVENREINQFQFPDDALVLETIDFDNDGDLDLIAGQSVEDTEETISRVLNTPGGKKEVHHLRLFVNNGDGGFTDVTEDSGVGNVQDVRGLRVVDLDNDGYEEILVITGELAMNRAFWNRGGVRFREISRGSQFSFLNSPSEVHPIDFDGDGSMDLFLCDQDGNARRVECEGGVNGWITLDFTGTLPGVRVAVTARDTDWILQTVQRKTGTHPQLTVGLGMVDRIESVEFYGPRSLKPVKVLKNVAKDQTLNVSFPELKAAPDSEGGLPQS